MRPGIRGKVIVVTGAARGLGRALALGLAREGARVAVLAREEHQAAATVAEIATQLPAHPGHWVSLRTSPTRIRYRPPPVLSTSSGAGSTH